MDLFPNPLPQDFSYPVTNRQLNTNHTLFPSATVPVRFNFDRDLSAQEVDDIEKERRRFHVWGTTNYRDFTGDRRTTKIAASFGGNDFAVTIKNFRTGKLDANGKAGPGWFWNWEQGHNEAT
jgi:hypothetical protein